MVGKRVDSGMKFCSHFDENVANVRFCRPPLTPLSEDRLEVFCRRQQLFDGGWDISWRALTIRYISDCQG